MREARATDPLKLLLPRNHGHGAWVFLATYGGGLVDGDHVRLTTEVRPGATALLSTQASTKVYRSPRGCRQELEATVGAEAALFLLPDPVACFAGARYDQRTTVDLAPGASLVLLDAWTCGRAAHGERWAFAHLRTTTTVTRGGRPLLLDAVLLDPADGPLAPRLGRFQAFAMLAAFGPRAARVREAILGPLGPPCAEASVLVTASPVGEDGAILRVAATSVEEATRTLRADLRALPDLLGDDPFARKW